MTLLLHKLIPEEIILRIFSFVSVVDMRNVVANHSYSASFTTHNCGKGGSNLYS